MRTSKPHMLSHVAVLILCFSMYPLASILQADDQPPVSAEGFDPRIRRHDFATESVKKSRRKSQPSGAGRYQMVAAGECVIILDTQTGETRIIEPASRVSQRVEVRKSWIAVSVIVNAGDRQMSVPRADHRSEEMSSDD